MDYPDKIKLAVNTNHKNKAPVFSAKEESDKWFSWYAMGFKNVELTVKAWISLINQGYAFTSQFSDQRRIMANFITSQHVALDFDHLPADFTIDKVASYDEFIQSHATFIYTTPSHKKDNPRYRVVFCLDRPIYNRDKYRELLLAISTKYSKEHDPSCKDPVRLFYGSENCQYLILGNSLSLEDARDKVVIPLRQKQEQERLTREEYLKNKVIVSKQGVPAEILQERMDKILAPLDGLKIDKWNSLRRVSYVLGGYVGGGYYEFGDVVEKIKAVADTMNTIADKDHAYATIEQAVNAGSEQPLYFVEEAYKHGSLVSGKPAITFATDKELVNELEGTSLSDEQKAEVAQRLTKFVNEKCWIAYHNGMRAAHKQAWLNCYGFGNGVLDIFGLGYREGYVDPETGEIVPSAYTVPMNDAYGNTVNVEYRTDSGEVRYQQETLPLSSYLVNEYFPAMEDKPVLMFADTIEAMNAMLNTGTFNYAGLPQLPLIPETFDNAPDLPHILVVDSQKRHNVNMRLFPKNTKVLRLPYSFDKLRPLCSGSNLVDFVVGMAK